MLASVVGAVLSGVEAVPVTVEVDVNPGLPAFSVVGLPDASVQEARERVRGAINHVDKSFPMQRITVNLAPSDIRKQGPGLDLAVALGLLVATGQAPRQGLEGRMFVGELGLSGEVRPVRGALASAEAARKRGLREVVCPRPNAGEAALAGVDAIGVDSLGDAIRAVAGRGAEPYRADPERLLADPAAGTLDLGQIRDQSRAKRALEVAAAGGHNLLLEGPPGTGKTLLARALPGILPRLTIDEALEVTRIHSAADLLPPGEALIRTRPFRGPHHGVSVAGMVGGGTSWIRPGEVTLSHRGILFLDEFPEFPRSVLEALRQPLEDGWVTVTRSRETVTYPARFMLVAAMNPCPCGHFGSATPCRCTPNQRLGYRQRISGPLLDRIDLHVQVPRVETDNLLKDADGDTSTDVRERVERARIRAAARGGCTSNAEIPPGRVVSSCELDPKAQSLLSRASDRHKLSARAVHRVLRVSRTIADLDGRTAVAPDDVMEALTYRIVARCER